MAKFAAKALSNAILFVLLVSPVVTIAAIEVMHKGFRRDMLNLMGEGFLSSLAFYMRSNALGLVGLGMVLIFGSSAISNKIQVAIRIALFSFGLLSALSSLVIYGKFVICYADSWSTIVIWLLRLGIQNL